MKPNNAVRLVSIALSIVATAAVGAAGSAIYSSQAKVGMPSTRHASGVVTDAPEYLPSRYVDEERAAPIVEMPPTF
jgi:hypothetical protein